MSHFMAEVLGTMILIICGDGVVAGVVLSKSKANNSGWIVITAGWALGVAIPVYIFGGISGAHFNPAVTLGLAAMGSFPWAQVPGYILAQMIGGFLGAVIVYLHYLKHWEVTEDKDAKLAVFCTGPAIRNTFANFLSEFIATFFLVFCILGLGTAKVTQGFGPLLVGLLIAVCGISLGGPTGYAMNPARDLAPRLAHFLLPIAGKRDSDWAYSWIPVVAPICGGIIAALTFSAIF